RLRGGGAGGGGAVGVHRGWCSFGGLSHGGATVIRVRIAAGGNIEAETVKGTARADAPTGTLAGVRVLVVEDEVDMADAVARGLRRAGYAVDVAKDGRTAIDKLAVTSYGVVCLDLPLPYVDGLDVCKAIRSGETMSTDARVLMLTARDGV